MSPSAPHRAPALHRSTRVPPALQNGRDVSPKRPKPQAQSAAHPPNSWQKHDDTALIPQKGSTHERNAQITHPPEPTAKTQPPFPFNAVHSHLPYSTRPQSGPFASSRLRGQLKNGPRIGRRIAHPCRNSTLERNPRLALPPNSTPEPQHRRSTRHRPPPTTRRSRNLSLIAPSREAHDLPRSRKEKNQVGKKISKKLIAKKSTLKKFPNPREALPCVPAPLREKSPAPHSFPPCHPLPVWT
jgi:hypothetical protein